MNYHLPYPIETVMKTDVQNIRRFEIGFRTMDPGPPARYQAVDNEAHMLTGDENIISVWFIVQFKIKNAADFLFRVEDPDKTVKEAAEAAMREVIGDNKIDTALTVGKMEIQNNTQKTLQDILDKYESGMHVVSVQLQEVHPPKEVRAAFKDVASAREDRNKYVNQAEGYRNDILPKAKGEAAQMIFKAEAYKAEKVERAEGDAHRFLSVLTEYRKAKDITRKRLYLETLEEVYQRGKKYIIDSKNSGVLPLLPLQSPEALIPQPTK
jgi:membrane protease subunit HflK